MSILTFTNAAPPLTRFGDIFSGISGPPGQGPDYYTDAGVQYAQWISLPVNGFRVQANFAGIGSGPDFSVSSLDAKEYILYQTAFSFSAVGGLYNVANMASFLSQGQTSAAFLLARDDDITASSQGSYLEGFAGADTLNGGVGIDFLDGGIGADTMLGGAGSDTYFVDSSFDIVDESVAGSNGVDTVRSSGISINLSFTSKFKGTVEQAALDGSANLSLTGNSLNNRLVGNSGVNIIYAGAGNDTVDGKAGADTMRGFTGNDTYYVDSSGDIVDESIAGSNGSDTVRSSNLSINLGFTSVFKGTLESAVLEGSANLNLSGNGLVNYLQGNNGANIINGGGGADTLVGLGGNDTFRFANSLGSTNIDKITDYNVAQDRIELDNAFFTALVDGFLFSSAFVANTTGLAQDDSDRIIYETDTGKLFYDSNGTASGGTYQQFAQLSVGLSVSAGEFFVT